MTPFTPSPSAKLRACLVLVAMLVLPALSCNATETEKVAKPVASQILFDEAPKYIQEQIRNVVLNCTEGTLTPDKARIFEFALPGQPVHYVYDYSAWAHHPLIPNCQNSPALCNKSGCLMTAYTQLKPNVFKQALRTYVLKLAPKEISEHTLSGSIAVIPGFEMTQSKYACRMLNGGKATCTLNFTWKNNKFAYFGFGAKDDQGAMEPAHEKLDESPASEDEPE